VHLGTFIDDPADWKYVAELDKLCEQTCYEGLNPLSAKLRSTRGFLTGEALTVPYYQNARMRKWVDATLREHAIKRVLVFSSAMCQYLLQDSASHTSACGRFC